MRSKAAKRLAFAEAQNWRCCYCCGVMAAFEFGPALATREHVVPLSQGGTWAAANTVAACLSCNRVRSDDFPCEAFAALRAELLRSSVWPPCTFPSRRVKRLIRVARRRSVSAEQAPASGAAPAVVFSKAVAPEASQDHGC